MLVISFKEGSGKQIMELFVDYWDPDVISQIADYYPIDGFTTNPKILSKATRPIRELIPEYRKLAEEKNLKAFFQVTADSAENMCGQARRFQEYFGDHLVIKIPAVKEGYKAVRLCGQAGITTCVTVVHSMPQALMAAKNGASYVAPYVTHIDNIGADSVGVIRDMVTAFDTFGYRCKVLGASFRTARQIERLAAIGCQAVTITPEMFEQLIAHSSTNESMEGFRKAWTEKFGSRQIDDFLPEG